MSIPVDKGILNEKHFTQPNKSPINSGQKLKGDPPYAKPHDKVKNGSERKTASDIADKFAPNRFIPTTADAKKGLLSLPAAMAAVDPQGLSSIAPMMYKMLGQIVSASSGSSQSSRKRIIEDSLTGALSILSKKYTFDEITYVFDEALKNGKIKDIDVEYRSIVKNALANFYKNYVDYGQYDIPVTVYNTVTFIGDPPAKTIYELEQVPDFYIQQYYTPENDPYPGYIQWLSQDGSDVIFTERKIGEYYYSSPEEEVYSISEQELAKKLDPYIKNANLTASVLNDLLIEQDTNVENNTAEKTGGKNSSQNLMSTLSMLAGYAGTISNIQQSVHIPLSVLNKGSIETSIQGFLKNIGQLKREKEWAKMASQPAQAASMLGQISGLAGSAKSLYDTIKS